MPFYDVSLWDFLKYASTQPIEFFPLDDRIAMAQRICYGLIYMNKEKISMNGFDIKLAMISSIG